MLRVIVLRFFTFVLGTFLTTFSSLNVANAADAEAGKWLMPFAPPAMALTVKGTWR